MSAFFVATVKMTNPEQFKEYSEKAGLTFAQFGGKLLTRGKAETALAGTCAHHAVGIVSFPDMAALTRWYESPEYQALIPLRDGAAEMDLVAYSVPA